MNRPRNDRAWFLVLPVVAVVAFSAVIPLMTVVNYSVQDTFGNNQFFWNGIGWYKELLDPATLAGNPGLDPALGTIRKLEVRSRGKSGRALSLRVTGERGELEVHGELRIRKALGGLRSSLFVVLPELQDGKLALLGGGHGHGVGLCQHGAMGMAKAGKDCEEILGHYYAEATLVKLW